MICIYCGAKKGKKVLCPRCGAWSGKHKSGDTDKNLALYTLYLNRFGLPSGKQK